MAPNASCQIRLVFNAANKAPNTYTDTLTFAGQSLSLSSLVQSVQTITYQPEYTQFQGCTAAIACQGVGVETRTFTCRQYNGAVAGSLVDNSNCTNVASLTQPCNSPAGNKIVSLGVSGSKTVSCPVGSTVETFVSVSCNSGYEASGETCIVSAPAVPSLVKNINTSTSEAYISNLITNPASGKAIFSATDGTTARVYVSDGTSSGTVALHNSLSYGSTNSSSQFNSFVNFGNKTYFKYNNNIWETQGTPQTTVLVGNAGYSSSFITVNGSFYGQQSGDYDPETDTYSPRLDIYKVGFGSPIASINYAEGVDLSVNNIVENNSGQVIAHLNYYDYNANMGYSELRNLNTSATISISQTEMMYNFIPFGNDVYLLSFDYNTYIASILKIDSNFSMTVVDTDLMSSQNFDNTSKELQMVNNKLVYAKYDCSMSCVMMVKTISITGQMVDVFALPESEYLMQSSYPNNYFGINATGGSSNQVFVTTNDTTFNTLKTYRLDLSTAQADVLASISMENLNIHKLEAGSTKLFMIAETVAQGRELYSIGDSSVDVLEVISGASSTVVKNSGGISVMAVSGDRAYFVGNEFINGGELWKSDGTVGSTNLIKNINILEKGSMDGTTYAGSVEMNGVVYFAASNEVNGLELWRTDGTENGTYMVKDINPGPSSSDIFNLIKFNNKIYFGANNGVNGRELWETDGTASGTVMAGEIYSVGGINANGLEHNLYYPISAATNRLLYYGRDSSGNLGIIQYNGTSISRLNSPVDGLASFNYRGLHLSPDKKTLYFTGSGVSNVSQLLRVTENSNVVERVTNLGSYSTSDITYPTLSGFDNLGRFYFGANIGGTRGLYRLESNSSTPELLMSISSTSGTVQSVGFYNGHTYVSINDNGLRLYRFPETGAGELFYDGAGYSFTIVNNKLYFIGFPRTNSNDRELYVYDGSQLSIRDILAGTSQGSIPTQLFAGANKLFFVPSNSSLSTANELWESDGTALGTKQVMNYHPNSNSLADIAIINVTGNKVYFKINNNVIGTELYKYGN